MTAGARLRRVGDGLGAPTRRQGFVLSAHGLALAIYARREEGDEEARWWSEFEREFHLYARRQADRKDAP